MTSSHELARELIREFREPHSTPTGLAPMGPVASTGGVELGDFIGGQADLLTVLLQRRSLRFFGPQPLPAAGVRDLALQALAADRSSWPTGSASSPLEVFVLALRLDGLVPGTYRLDDDGSLHRVADLTDSAADLTIQSEFADAAAIISIASDLAAASSALGAHGYRQLLARAGAAAYDMWLDAVALGWAGTVFAGFIPASVRTPLGSDGTDRHQLFALALGHPAPIVGTTGESDPSTAERRKTHGST